LSKIITKDLEIDSYKLVKIKYGIECFLYEIIKLILFIFVFFIFGTLKLSLISLFTSSTLRYISGGVHCNTFIKCLILSSIIFTTTGYLGSNININSNHYFLVGIILTIITLYKAPISPPEKPITNNKKIIKMKCISVIILLIILLIPYIFNLDNSIKTTIILSMTFQVFSLTYLGNKFFNFWNYQVKEVNK
jgi:accessory gene regulator B